MIFEWPSTDSNLYAREMVNIKKSKRMCIFLIKCDDTKKGFFWTFNSVGLDLHEGDINEA